MPDVLFGKGLDVLINDCLFTQAKCTKCITNTRLYREEYEQNLDYFEDNRDKYNKKGHSCSTCFRHRLSEALTYHNVSKIIGCACETFECECDWGLTLILIEFVDFGYKIYSPSSEDKTEITSIIMGQLQP